MSSHSSLKAESITSARGMRHLIDAEMAVPGVAQEKNLVGVLTGVTVRKDAKFQVGIDFPSSPQPKCLHNPLISKHIK